MAAKNGGKSRLARKHDITPLMYLYNAGESSFIMTQDSLEYSPVFPFDPGLLLRNSRQEIPNRRR